ncbi:nuclear transport factor 2 family protein [Bradyrhizobium sp. AUGA SZCCT0283]|uniref:nuclear transport factor 2 family protein n=1 Tax=Bradyrhizobium sp. AUGA SZCCT0283 TaxID=2807671 RepID=UPI001BAAA128|nr:nuclear transport factor 2 family protein [Bradyrhizobium sp. AUGA SZCCT0283]MBR1279990.1 nuclear transport factor 2 family protein [Bradyrhizobium sp. AUGA SZCCT0283]
MANAKDRFDAIGIVVDWIDACKQRRLEALLDLYDDGATVECCEGGNFTGRSEMERYWRPRLARAGRRAFTIDALMPEEDGVSLDYRDYDGRPMRTHFRFNHAGKIRLTACEPIQLAA